MAQSWLLNELYQIKECLGKLVLLIDTLLQKFEMIEELLWIVLVEQALFERGGCLFLLLELLEDVLWAETFGVDVSSSVRDSGRSTEIGQNEISVLLEHQILTVEICEENIEVFHKK